MSPFTLASPGCRASSALMMYMLSKDLARRKAGSMANAQWARLNSRGVGWVKWIYNDI